MRFRSADWDVEMPPSLVAYWTAWNEPDVDCIRGHVDGAVTSDIVWNDPRDSFVGVDALEAAMVDLRSTKPEYRFTIESEIDGHNNRFRYRWNMARRGRVLMEGLDIATLNDAGFIERVDGFFGHPTPVLEGDSGVPAAFR